MKIKGKVAEKQIQQILSYIQGELADVWKENILKDLKVKLLEYKIVGKFLADIKKEFRERDKETVKVTELEGFK